MGGEPRTLGPDAPANVGRPLLAALLTCVISACGGAGTTATGPTNGTNSGSSGTATYNVDLLGVPQFVNVVYIDLTQTDPATHGPLINQISKFRSSAGHDYSDSTGGRARGINSRSDLIISRALRDANPLTCSGQTFTTLNDPLPAVVRF